MRGSRTCCIQRKERRFRGQKDVRGQNRSGVGRLLLYGVHKGVSRAAVHQPDLAMTCLYSTMARERTGKVNKQNGLRRGKEQNAQQNRPLNCLSRPVHVTEPRELLDQNSRAKVAVKRRLQR